MRASLVAQTVKHLPAIPETRVQFLWKKKKNVFVFILKLLLRAKLLKYIVEDNKGTSFPCEKNIYGIVYIEWYKQGGWEWGQKR